MSFKPPTSRLVVSLLSLAMLAGWAFYFFGLEPFLEAAYAGTSWEYFNDHAARWRLRHPDPSLRTFVQEATGLFFRLGSLATGIAAVGISFWMVAPRRIRTFLNAETSPFNLAFFRIVLFGYLLTVDVRQAAWFAQLPDVLQVPPPGWEFIVPVLPTDPGVVSTAGILFKAACLTGLVGCWSRTSAAIVAVLGLYVLGLPQFYGKINHNHHLLWFSGLLATSRCGDALALDAVWTAWRRPAASVPPTHRRYAQPLRYMWVLLGIIYFFPGFWKLANEGLTWALSDNLKFRMHHLWFGLNDFTPLFQLDRYPLLYQAGGLATIAFEISFVFSLPFRTLRHLAMGAALLFHQATAWFLAIYFASLPPLPAAVGRLGPRLETRRTTVPRSTPYSRVRRRIGLGAPCGPNAYDLGRPRPNPDNL